MNSSKHIAICGAGLVGSLLSIYLAKRGYKVSVFERRGDMRHGSYVGGRSINLALSNRGIRALAEVGLAEEIKKVAIPMHGRVMHNRAGELSFLQYGKEGQFINSVSRSALNIVLMDKAEELGVDFHFEQRITKVDLEKTTLTLDHGESTVVRNFDLIIGADGAFSAVRGALQFTDRFDYSQDYIDHGYKELHIPPGTAGSFQLEKNDLVFLFSDGLADQFGGPSGKKFKYSAFKKEVKNFFKGRHGKEHVMTHLSRQAKIHHAKF